MNIRQVALNLVNKGGENKIKVSGGCVRNRFQNIPGNKLCPGIDCLSHWSRHSKTLYVKGVRR